MITKTKLKIYLICLVLLLIIGSVILYLYHKKQIARIRDEYPVVEEYSYFIDDARLSFDDRMLIAPSIAKVEVTRQLPDYTVHIEDKEVGISGDVEFCCFQLKLISNVAGSNIVTDDGGLFEVIFAKELKMCYPEMKKGMVAICSLEAASGVHRGKYLFFDRSFYYIYNNMALAAYEGDDSLAREMCREEDLIKRIGEITGLIHKETERYDE